MLISNDCHFFSIVVKFFSRGNYGEGLVLGSSMISLVIVQSSAGVCYALLLLTFSWIRMAPTMAADASVWPSLGFLGSKCASIGALVNRRLCSLKTYWCASVLGQNRSFFNGLYETSVSYG